MNAIRVYCIDPTYGGDIEFFTPSGQRISYKKHLSNELGLSFKYENLGASADLPTFYTAFRDAATVVIAAFFLAKPIKDNFEVWRAGAKRISIFFSKNPIFEREGAALLVVEKLVTSRRLRLREFKLIGYNRLHIGEVDLPNVPTPNGIARNGKPINLGYEVHNFLIEVNGRHCHAIVNGKTVKIISLKK